MFVLWVLPALIFGWLGNRWVENRSKIPQAERRRRKARKIALKQLKEARSALANKSDAFYEVLLKSMDSYLGDKMGISRSEMSGESIAEILSQKGVKKDDIEQLLSVIKRCEFARYAPSGSESDQRDLIDRAEQVILKMEESV
jgi:hypothetical protein